MPSGTKLKWQWAGPLFVGLFFLSLLSGRTLRVPWYEQWISTVFYPLQWTAHAVGNGISGVWHHYIYLVGVQKTNEALVRQLQDLHGRLIGYEETKLENQRLHSLLGLAETLNGTPIVARVIAHEPRTEFQSILINKGREDGLLPNLPVVTSEGLVGRVGPVTAHQAQVLLITDANSAVDVIVERSRVRALLVGDQKQAVLKHDLLLARMEYLRQLSDVQTDDVVVTSGLDKIFPKGLPVGTVQKIVKSKYGIFQKAGVLPFVDFSTLEEVLLLIP